MTETVLLFGASGQVGSALQRTAPPTIRIIAHDARRTDIRNASAIASAISEARATAIVNCAAFTQVDAAESHQEDAREVNAVAPGNIARIAAGAGARLIHISTDYVFDGRAHSPYTTDAPVGPVCVYGATKFEGERRVRECAPDSAIVRTAWVHSGGGANFVRTAVRHLTAGRQMRVVDDQIGTPTRAEHLARALWQLYERPTLRGILHFTDAGVASWFDVAFVVADTLRRVGRLPAGAGVTPIHSSEYPTPARRPAYSVLDKHTSWRALDYIPPHWSEGVVASTLELLNA